MGKINSVAQILRLLLVIKHTIKEENIVGSVSVISAPGNSHARMIDSGVYPFFGNSLFGSAVPVLPSQMTGTQLTCIKLKGVPTELEPAQCQHEQRGNVRSNLVSCLPVPDFGDSQLPQSEEFQDSVFDWPRSAEQSRSKLQALCSKRKTPTSCFKEPAHPPPRPPPPPQPPPPPARPPFSSATAVTASMKPPPPPPPPQQQQQQQQQPSDAWWWSAEAAPPAHPSPAASTPPQYPCRAPGCHREAGFGSWADRARVACGRHRAADHVSLNHRLCEAGAAGPTAADGDRCSIGGGGDGIGGGGGGGGGGGDGGDSSGSGGGSEGGGGGGGGGGGVGGTVAMTDQE